MRRASHEHARESHEQREQREHTHEIGLRITMDYDHEVWECVIATARISALDELELLHESLTTHTDGWHDVPVTFGSRSLHQEEGGLWILPVEFGPDHEERIGAALANVRQQVPTGDVTHVPAFVRQHGPKDRTRGTSGSATWLVVSKVRHGDPILKIPLEGADY